MPPELYGPAGAVAALAFVVIALVRGDIVPGWIYKQTLARAEKAEAISETAIKSVDNVTATVQKALDERTGPAHG